MKSKRKNLNLNSNFSKAMYYIQVGFRNFDLYGRPVVLTYKGKEKFKTFLGGFVSFWILLLIFSYMVLLLQLMIEKGGTSQAKNSLKRTLNYDTQIHYIGQNGFDFAFHLESDSIDYLSDPSYVTMEISQVSQTWATDEQGVTQNSRVKTELSYEK